MGHEFASRGNVLGISAGTQSASSGSVVFSNSNGISFGMSGSSRITASYTVPTETVPMWQNRYVMMSVAESGSRTINYVQRTQVPNYINATAIQFPLVAYGGVGTATFTAIFGVYTMSGSTASLLSGASSSFSWNRAAFASAGGSWTNVPMGTMAITPGDYLMLFVVTQNSTTNDPGLGIYTFNTTIAVPPGAGSMSLFFDGRIGTQTTSPSSIHLSQISNAPCQPMFNLVGS